MVMTGMGIAIETGIEPQIQRGIITVVYLLG